MKPFVTIAQLHKKIFDKDTLVYNHNKCRYNMVFYETTKKTETRTMELNITSVHSKGNLK